MTRTRPLEQYRLEPEWVRNYNTPLFVQIYTYLAIGQYEKKAFKLYLSVRHIAAALGRNGNPLLP
jgi:hypothetical protein